MYNRLRYNAAKYIILDKALRWECQRINQSSNSQKTPIASVLGIKETTAVPHRKYGMYSSKNRTWSHHRNQNFDKYIQHNVGWQYTVALHMSHTTYVWYIPSNHVSKTEDFDERIVRKWLNLSLEAIKFAYILGTISRSTISPYAAPGVIGLFPTVSQ